MPQKRQHYVPKTYLKSWEVSFPTKDNSNEPSTGVFVYTKSNGSVYIKKKIDSILYMSNAYTVDYNHSFIIQFCPRIRDDFGIKITRVLVERSVYVYHNGVRLDNPALLGNNLHLLDEWIFFDILTSLQVPKKPIKNLIVNIKSYVLEDAFSTEMENNWFNALNVLYESMHIAQGNVSPGEPLHVPISIIEIMLWMTLLMLHRNPSFDGYGVFPEVEKMLFSEILNEFDGDSDNLARVKEMLSEQRKGLWLVAIYSALFREKDSSFNKLFEKLLDKGQIVIFGIKDYVYGKFITSDNPSFININNVTRNNMNGLYFPLSPDYLLAIFRNSDKQFRSIEYREVNQKDLLTFNTIIWNNAISAVISNSN